MAARAVVVVVLVTACSGCARGAAHDALPATLLAAGNISSCTATGVTMTGSLVASHPGTVAALGDNVYEAGTLQNYLSCLQGDWAKSKSRMRPTPGNHEYLDPGAAGYFAYFGAAAGPPGQGWYSYELGAWHVVVLNSNCDKVSCLPGSPQERWLAADLARHAHTCLLAYWHSPRFSSGFNGNDRAVEPFWNDLYRTRADVVVNAHDHDYERFAPLAPDGRLDARGIREFVVGTGGKSLAGTPNIVAGSEVRESSTFGLLDLTLGARGYDWRFLAADGGAFTDTGSGTCHAFLQTS